MDLNNPDQVERVQIMGPKKLKPETDEENSDVKFKDFLLSLKTMPSSEDAALCVVDLLTRRSGVIQEALKKLHKGDLTALAHQVKEQDQSLAAAKDRGEH